MHLVTSGYLNVANRQSNFMMYRLISKNILKVYLSATSNPDKNYTFNYLLLVWFNSSQELREML